MIARVFLGLFVLGGGSGANRLFENTLAGGDNGQVGICYNPDGLGTSTGPSGDLVYLNLVSGFKIGIQTSPDTRGNLFRENDLAFVQEGIEEESPAGANVFDGNFGNPSPLESGTRRPGEGQALEGLALAIFRRNKL